MCCKNLARMRERRSQRIEESVADLIELHWRGSYADLVAQHPQIVATHQEGTSHVIFPEGTRFEPDAKLAKRAAMKSNTIGRYTLPDGAMFIFDGVILSRFLLSF